MKITVNDVEMEAPAGMSVIDAVFAAGYDVPYFCSQEYMSPVGACRMCLAKIGAPRKDRATNDWIRDEDGAPQIFWFPNPMATCTTTVMEGMVVDTVSKTVRQAQDAMVEAHLINHPLDCPTCDKGGACELQDRSYEYGSGTSRFPFDKRHQEKHHALSDLITLDRERCIHCKRCVRYFEEVPGDEVLDFIERGSHTYIASLEPDGLNSPFSGNITDICPVGALLDGTSRFRGRNWEYHHTATTTLNDPGGAALTIDARTGRIERIKAALNPEVNKTWIDDASRFGHEHAASSDRFTLPHVRRDGELVPVSWEEATQEIATRLQGVDPKSIGIAIRSDATLEEGVAARALAEQLGTGRIDHAPRPAASVLPDGQPASLSDVASADGLLVIGDPTEEAGIVDLRIKDALKGVTPPTLLPHGVPIADLRLKERMPRKREILTVLAPYRTDLMKHAGFAHVAPSGGEARLLRALADRAGDGEAAQGAWPSDVGLDAEQADALLQRLRAAGSPVLIWSGFVSNDPDADEAARSLAKAVGAKVLILGPMANAFGLERSGVLPSHPRYAYASMLNGDAGALIVSELDPAIDPKVAAQLAKASLLVAHATFPNATTALAHVVLPAVTGFEKEGTTVNAEGRLLPVRPAPVEAGAAKDVTGVVKHLGDALGVRLEGRSVRSARRVLQKRLDVDLSDLPPVGLRLAPPKRGARGVRAIQQARVGRGAALVVPSMVRADLADRNPGLRADRGAPALRMHPADAAKAKVADGDPVIATVGGVPRRLVVRSSEGVPEGLYLVPTVPEQPVGLYAFDPTALKPAPREPVPAERGQGDAERAPAAPGVG
ncbi:MAG: NADH-quinone oxidoreductase subunit NuoG [Trueperaceae bacterium]